MSPTVKRRSLLAIRLLLGGVFLLSGVGKLIESNDARYLVELMATEFYWLIEYADAIVIGTTAVELGLAGLLFWGRRLTWALLGSAALLLFFAGVLGYFYLRGFNVASCGCFGAFGGGGGIGVSLLRNLVLLAMIAGTFLLMTYDGDDEK